MSSLQRYKKSGGFIQLVSLIETFGPQKREKFLEMIELESRPWCLALREKILTMERMLFWPDDQIVEVFRQLPVKSFAYAMSALKPEHQQRLEALLQSPERRRLAEAMSENKPTADEIASVLVKVIEVARKKLSAKEIQPGDELLQIPEDIEQLLEQRNGPWSPGAGARPKPPQGPIASSPSVGAAAKPPENVQVKIAVVPAASVNSANMPPAATPAPAASASLAEVEHLRKTLGSALKENQTLKEELRIAKEKLEQIRKIA